MVDFASLTPEAKQELWATLALRHAEGIDPRRAKKLVASYGSAFAAASAGLASSQAWVTAGIAPLRSTQAFIAESWREKAKQEWMALQKTACSFLTWNDPLYPAVLKELVDAPILLYYKGDITQLHGPSVGVVGARNCTREGLVVSEFFSKGLSKAGVTVVSGMAKGIDRVAHKAGLSGAGGSIAVLGTGVDVIYPLCNEDLYHELVAKGLIISEFAPGTPASPKNFPVRNRLISGISQGILVVEAAGRSGSLITARLALEQNRDVFAVPGHTMASSSEGCRELIRKGAKAVFSADDILQELAPLLALEAQSALQKRQKSPQKEDFSAISQAASSEAASPARLTAKKQMPLSNAKKRTDVPQECCTPAEQSKRVTVDVAPEERAILAALSYTEQHIDVVARALDMDVAKLSGALIMLEIRGLVKRLPGMLYALSEEAYGN